MDVHLNDSEGRSLTASVSVGVVGRPQEGHIDEVYIIPGLRDIHIRAPWPLLGFDEDNSSALPIVKLAIFRTRAIGELRWQYGTVLPIPSQSSCRRDCGASHASGLTPETDYELQAAWMWNACPGWHSGCANHNAWWRVDSNRENWWHPWMDADRIHWSESFHFRTRGHPRLSSVATSDTIVVSWTSTTGEYWVTATSPDWPGAIWADPDNSYQEQRTIEAERHATMSAVFREIPADTPFKVTVQEHVPAGFGESPRSVAYVRTGSELSSNGLRPTDPSDFEVRFVNEVLQLEYSEGWPLALTTPRLLQLKLGTNSTGFERSRRQTSWSHENVIGLEPFLHDHRARVQVLFQPIPPDSHLLLTVSRTPRGSARSNRMPYQCVVWTIRVPPADPHSYLDHFWHSSESSGVPTIQADTQPTQFRSGRSARWASQGMSNRLEMAYQSVSDMASYSDSSDCSVGGGLSLRSSSGSSGLLRSTMRCTLQPESG